MRAQVKDIFPCISRSYIFITRIRKNSREKMSFLRGWGVDRKKKGGFGVGKIRRKPIFITALYGGPLFSLIHS